MRLERQPIESTDPVRTFAGIRVLVAAAAALALLILDFPFDARLFTVVVAAALPWSVAVLLLVRRSPQAGLHPLVVAGDLAVVVLMEAVAGEAYAATRFLAIFLIAVHAHFQGAERGFAIAAAGTTALVTAGRLTDGPVDGDVLDYYDALFVVSALATAVVVGGLRAAESTGRVRARGLVQRTFAREDEVRRELAETLHDGPVQELASLELMLDAARRAATNGDSERVCDLIAQAQEVASRNTRALRDEIVSLGPQAFEELSFGTALERCMPVWQRQWSLRLEFDLDALELDSELEGGLFRIAQEAVSNAGKHSGAEVVRVTLHRKGPDRGELTVEDDGRGFQSDPLGSGEPGHIGLASMRERAQLIGGELSINGRAGGTGGTAVCVEFPLGARG